MWGKADDSHSHEPWVQHVPRKVAKPRIVSQSVKRVSQQGTITRGKYMESLKAASDIVCCVLTGKENVPTASRRQQIYSSKD